MTADTAVVDLRQYTLAPGRRDTLIGLFDEHFVDGQEAVGIQVVGQFRDLDDPDRFVWLRAFDSMAARGEALPRFYHGPVWRAHREHANATMVDSDDALLLEPTYLGAGYPRPGAKRRPGPTDTVVAITIAYLNGPVTDADHDLSETVRAGLAADGTDVLAAFTTHAAENNFPALPLRDEHVLVWITRFTDDAEHVRHREHLAASPQWSDAIGRLAARSNRLPMQQLRLRPTAGSRLR